MMVKFVLLTPGNHHQIAQTSLDTIPREGEHVEIDDVTRIVHSVLWSITDHSVTVLLEE